MLRRLLLVGIAAVVVVGVGIYAAFSDQSLAVSVAARCKPWSCSVGE
jgi:hypothetical protein